MPTTHLWIVEAGRGDAPEFLSVHSTREKATKARTDYTHDYRHGGTDDDYRVREVRLDWTGVEPDPYAERGLESRNKPLRELFSGWTDAQIDDYFAQ